MITEIINELEQELAEYQKQMDSAKSIEEWLMAYREYLGVFLKLHTPKTYEVTDDENDG